MNNVLWNGEDGIVEEDDGSDLVEKVPECEKSDLDAHDEVVESMDQLVHKVQDLESERKQDDTPTQKDRSWVEREFDTTKAVVRKVLEEKERARNSDKYLIWFIRHKVEGHDLNNFDEYVKASSPETIRRVRQEIQNNEREFLPTDPEVIEKRRFKEEEVREYYSNIHACCENPELEIKDQYFR